MDFHLEQLFSLPSHILDGVKYHLGGNFFTPKPRMIQFPVCDRCNAKCIMCNRWQKEVKKEISTEKIREVFTNDLFSKIEDVSLHGGEPTLRKDLADICKTIQDAFPKLKQLWISTNGFGPKRIERRIKEILDVLHFSKLNSLDINVSIDGLEETHDKIRGVKGGFRQSIETIQMLMAFQKTFPIKITMGTVIQPLNLYQIDEVQKLAGNLGVPIHFQPLMFDKFFNIPSDSNLRFSKNDLAAFKELIERKLIKDCSTTSFYWRDLLSMMNGNNRKSPCAFDRYVFSLYPTGEVLPCSREDWIVFGDVYSESADKIWFSRNAKEIRKKMRKDVCPTCANYCGVEFSLHKEFFKYLNFYLKNKLFI